MKRCSWIWNASHVFRSTSCLFRSFLVHERQRQYVPPKRRQTATRLSVVLSQKTVLFNISLCCMIKQTAFRRTSHILQGHNLSLWLSVLLLELGRFFSFLVLFTVGRTPLTGDQPVAKPLPTHRKTQTQNKRTHRHPCLKWDSNPWSQCSSERRHSIP
jgi:hypothetical protein